MEFITKHILIPLLLLTLILGYVACTVSILAIVVIIGIAIVQSAVNLGIPLLIAVVALLASQGIVFILDRIIEALNRLTN